MAELVTTVGVEKDEAIAGTTRRDFLGKAAATGVAVGLIAAGEPDTPAPTRFLSGRARLC